MPVIKLFLLPQQHLFQLAEVVTYFNAVPVLCDIKLTDHNIDPDKIESLITEKTKSLSQFIFLEFHVTWMPFMQLRKNTN